MSATAEGLQIPIGMSLDEAQLALQQLEQMARAAGKRVKTGLGEGTEGVEKSTNSLMQFAREQKREASTARYFVSEFAAFLPVGSASREVLMSLTSALVGGSAFGFALEAVTLGVRFFTEYLKEDELAQKKAAEAAAAHGKVLRDLTADTDAYIRGLHGVPASLEFMYGKQREFSEKTLADRKRVAEIERDLAKENDDLESWDNWRSGETIRQNLLEERKTLLGGVKTAQEELDAAIVEGGRRANAESEKVATDRLAKRLGETKKAIEDLRAMQAAAMAASADSNMLYNGGPDYYAEQAKRYAEYRVNAQKAANDADDAEFIRHEEYKQFAIQAAVDAENAIFIAAYEERLRVEQQVQGYAVNGLRQFATAAVGQFGTVVTSSRAYNKAMKAAGLATVEGADLSAAAFAKMGQDILGSIAQQALVESIMNLARGFAFSSMGNAASASAAFTASGYFAATATAAGAAAFTIGQTRGTTRAEREAISNMTPPADPPRDPPGGYSPSGAREVGGAGGGVGQVHTREVIVLIGEGIFTPQELAAAHARRQRLAEDLGLLRVST